MRYVYFPTTCIISLLYVMEDGASAEIAIVGKRGILGISLFMGQYHAEPRHCAKRGTRFPTQRRWLKNEFERYGPTMHLLLLQRA